MIKTMLLTAQLALSPIVGTNGLQPKRLPNPVYGETTDYSVTFNGETYTRVMTEEAYAKNIKAIENYTLIIGYQTTNPQKVVSDNLDWAKTTTLDQAPTNAYIAWYCAEDIYEGDEVNITEYTCFSMWWGNGISDWEYAEVFCSEDETNIFLYIFEKRGNDWECIEMNRTYPELAEGYTFQNYDPIESPNWNGFQRHIQNKQPTTPNPSIYDNIYNFYYDNLFANEALDELGAEVGNNSLTMRQWLAHTATIISISLLSAALVILVIKIFKLIASSISDIWG